MIFNNSQMEVLYYDKTPADEHWPCVVRLTEAEIVVEYQDEETVIYHGDNDGSGHFLMTTDDGAKATLHMFPSSDVMEGGWIEEGKRGMWRIRLSP